MKDKILLLNASNYQGNLVYPYAFVQISEIASRYGIDVTRADLFGTEITNWKELLKERLSKNDFKAIFITMRNIDTHGVHEYPPEIINQKGSQEVYYPIVLTKKLVEAIKEISKLPIVIGGFGYSILPEKILQFLNADFGVSGEPEGLFENFQILTKPQEIENVPNLYHNNNGVVKSGPRKLYGPAKTREYTDTIVDEIKEFKLKHQEKENVSFVNSIAVEISRGCPYNCSFCCEPIVNGRLMRYRNLDVIIDDLRFLQKQGFYEIFFVCSELNPLGNDFTIKLSEKVYELNMEFKEEEKIKWLATYLMNFSLEEFNKLKKSGFVGGWYDIISLDDENLKRNNAPYTTKEILQIISNLDGGLKGGFILEDEVLTLQERIYHNKHKTHTGSFFLGNPTVTIQTIRETLLNANKFRLDTIYDKTGINFATRIFDYICLNKHELRETYSINFEGNKIVYNDLYPSFSYPPDLIEHFGSSQKIRDFFTYIQTTFLSSEYLFNIDWQEFIIQNIDSRDFCKLWFEIENIETIYSMIKVPKEVKTSIIKLTVKNFQDFYFTKYEGSELIKISSIINAILQIILIFNSDKILGTFHFLKLPENVFEVLEMPIYDIMKIFYSKIGSIVEINKFKENLPKNSLDKLFVNYFWIFKNIKLDHLFIPFFN